MEFVVDVRDTELIALLKRVSSQFSPAGQRQFLGEWIDDLIDLGLFKVTYPPQSNAELPEIYNWGDGKLHKFPSLKAQHGFFGALKHGLRIPYSRTQELEDAAQVSVDYTNTGATLHVELSASQRRGKRFDPKWVVGELNQQSYYFQHRTNWIPFRETIQQRQPRIEAVGVAVLEAKLEQIS